MRWPARETMPSAPAEPDAMPESPARATEDDAADAANPTASVSAHPESNPPRLAIASLRLENFKSYGGVVDVGPFHKSFSAVVGPNGSGKSNVIDAMLFVFGRRAKQLRHSKLRELLHHSDTHPNVASATVTVYFHEIVDTGDGDADFEVEPGSAFSVARRAFRNDTSKYYLNEKEVKMTLVVDLLKAKGVDLDNNRFLILQGEVEQIAMMKPKATTLHEDGLLEYLEDIIGSNRHVEAIVESGKQVEVLNEERSHKLNRVKAAERERDALEDAKNEAEDFMDKERELLTKRLRVTRSAWHEKAEKVLESETKEKDARKALETSRSLLKDAESRAEVVQNEFETKKGVANRLSEELNASKEKYAASERADIELGTELKAIKAKEKKAKAAVEREAKRAEKAEEDVAAHEAEMEAAEAEVPALKAKLAAASAEHERVHGELRRKTEPLRNELEKKKETLLPRKDNVNQCQRDADVTSSERDLLEQSLNEPITAYEVASANLKVLKEELAASRLQKDEVLKRQAAGKACIATNRTAADSARDRVKRSTALVSDLRHKLEETKQASESLATSNNLFAALYRASREGKVKGIVGRLGDLGTIVEKYGVAAGAAAGASLDNMVVRTAEDAQACIRFMRKYDLGRSTFIILEKISYLEKYMTATRFDGPRLFDHVRTEDERNRIAFYFALRDTLVAQNLDEARRMAYKPTKQNRVVTVEGELIESSGAMTGGGRGPPRHRLASKQSGVAAAVASPTNGADPQKLAQELQAAVNDLRAAAEEVDRLEAESCRLAMELEQVETELVKISNNVASLMGRVGELTSSSIPALRKAAADALRVLEDKANPKIRKLAALASKLESFQIALGEAKEACVDLERDIDEIQAKIVDSGGSELQDAKDAVDRSQRAISENQSAVSGARSRADATRKAMISAQTAAAKAHADIEQARLDREKVSEKRAAIEDEAEALSNTYKELEARHDEAAEEVRSLSKDFAAVKAELKKGRQEELPLVEAVNDANRAVVVGRAEVKDMRKTVKKLKCKLAELADAASEAALPDAANVANEAGEEDGAGNESIEMEAAGMDVDEGGDDAPVDKYDEGEGENVVLSNEERKELEMAIAVLEGELANIKPNLCAIAEYRRKNDEYKSQVGELDDLTARRDVARKENDALRKARLDEFMQGFSAITLKLKELYQMITLGGDAELELVDSLDPFSEGIVFSVRPPKKSWKNISNLSGGEKTLSSLALVFALHHFKPTPLYFLDEIDAALDFKNVSIVANYVKERTKNAQFIIISLRNNMFELADRLVGIYKTHNTTKSVTVNPKAFLMPAVQRKLSTEPLREQAAR
jgi:structural maintenance of chromosome 4